ncbi:MAG: carboxylating nicotinate-nucleotide diphosphorylase [Alphaproteobacteria bacterium]|nr:MAG: carboxylating nicotinate-nucleotide diphosphorylase [Alphaproteobacteria bacterium]
MHSFIPTSMLQSALQAAFAEDLGGYGDITTMSTVSADQTSTAHIVARQDGIVCGIEIAEAAFLFLDDKIQFKAHVADGKKITAGQKLATITGSTASLLTAERVALNFMCHLSGISTMTGQYVDAIQGSNAKITCTRKTRPLLRVFEKYAVRVGGGHNHRFNLSDAILIKDNHIAANGGDVIKTVRSAKESMGHMVRISVEVDRIDQIDAAIAGGADVILLDNMSPQELKQSVQKIAGRAVCEASGGVNLQTVAAIAASGVDFISVGRITHSAPWLDLALDF